MYVLFHSSIYKLINLKFNSMGRIVCLPSGTCTHTKSILKSKNHTISATINSFRLDRSRFQLAAMRREESTKTFSSILRSCLSFYCDKIAIWPTNSWKWFELNDKSIILSKCQAQTENVFCPTHSGACGEVKWIQLVSARFTFAVKFVQDFGLPPSTRNTIWMRLNVD